MRRKIFFTFVSFLLGSLAMFGQWWEYHGGYDPVEMQVGSPFDIGGEYKIDANNILPLSISVKNNELPRSIYILFTDMVPEYIKPTNYTPVENGYFFLSENPSQVVYMDVNEIKLFRFQIQINSDKFQIFEAILFDSSNNNQLHSFGVYINNPKYNHRDYITFNEADLCNFDFPAHVQWLGGSFIFYDDTFEGQQADPQCENTRGCCSCCNRFNCGCQEETDDDPTRNDEGGDANKDDTEAPSIGNNQVVVSFNQELP